MSDFDTSFLLVTYDSCRTDVLRAADTPVLDSLGTVMSAQAPANFTYPSHLSFFAGILPNVDDDVPLYNRFNRQLIGMREVGETNVVKDAVFHVESDVNVVEGLRRRGYQTVGAGAMNWFRQVTLQRGFERFAFTGTDADAQVDFLLREIDTTRPFFGFVNFGETHAPFTWAGKKRRCRVDVRARRMTWPPGPERGRVGVDSPAFEHQAGAAHFLDARLDRLVDRLPADTVVVVCADHGEAFGEDGYWGHGVSHPTVWDVPLAIFRPDGRPIGG